ncbi:MAG: putative hemolysin [Limisphaerales bacterium]|jgi:putative hemolysin
MAREENANNVDRMQSFFEVLPYLKELKISLPKAVASTADMEPVIAASSAAVLDAEVQALPADQLLMEHRQFRVHFATAEQIPLVLREIGRLREITFRAFQEGNGGAEDRDDFDLTYLHLFAWDNEAKALVGAYRLGQTDILRQDPNVGRSNEGIYLSQFFNFEENFFDGPPMLEIGRSFVTPDYQKNHNSLFLLWCGISRYLKLHPKYRRLYGLVSMSRLYDGKAMAVMRDVLLEPRDDVSAGERYDPDLGEPWQKFLEKTRPFTMKDLSRMVKALDPDEKDVPALIRHYHKLGATFHEMAIDTCFNNTPGLLIRLNAPQIPPKYMKMYFGENWEAYVDYQSPVN